MGLLLPNLLLGPGPAVASEDDILSHWQQGEVQINGENTEWKGIIHKLTDNGVDIAVQNDDHYLYIAVFIGDRRQMAHVLMTGMSVWFDPAAGKEPLIGVRYPLGLPPESRRDYLRSLPTDPTLEMLQEVAQQEPEGMELLGPGTVQKQSAQIGQAGIEAALKVYSSSLVQELKIPLSTAAGSAHAIGAQPGQKIAILIESALPTRSKLRGDDDEFPGSRGGLRGGRGGKGGGPGGMGRGPGGRGRGPGGRGGESQRLQAPQALKQWVKVTLASPPLGN
jgi:hypothetical protein